MRSIHLDLARWHSWRRKKKSGVPFKIHVLIEARPSASLVEDPHRSSDRLRRRASLGGYPQNTLRDAPHIFSSIVKVWSFSCKAKYARLRTFPPSPFGATEDVPRSLLGLRGSSFQPCIVPRRIKGLLFGRFFASKTRLYQRSFIALARYSRLPLPSIGLKLSILYQIQHLTELSYTSSGHKSAPLGHMTVP